MITPKEARNTMMKIESNDAYYGELQEELKLMAAYIAQQEKKDNLLELYRELLFITKFEKSISNDNYKECVNSIIALEIELKEEMK